MAKKGDTPLTDLLQWEVEVFHPKVDQLIRKPDAEGGLDEWAAPRYINRRAEWWRKLTTTKRSDAETDFEESSILVYVATIYPPAIIDATPMATETASHLKIRFVGAPRAAQNPPPINARETVSILRA
jgi:hypothetical protein